ERTRLMPTECGGDDIRTNAIIRADRRRRAQISEYEHAYRRGEIAATLLVDLADDGGERAPMMVCDRLEAVPKLVLEADAGFASGDDHRPLGDRGVHECPYVGNVFELTFLPRSAHRGQSSARRGRRTCHTKYETISSNYASIAVPSAVTNGLAV